MGWDLLVDRKDLRRTTLVPADPDIVLADGEALLAVESFALTANNITYGAVGDQVGYWKFFPAPDGLGRIPVWGFARVVRSSAADAPVGLRLFGYWPMSRMIQASPARTIVSSCCSWKGEPSTVSWRDTRTWASAPSIRTETTMMATL